ncbi:MAG: DUF111 family protein [Synergistetes bacterium]|nr:DUF111 family protein [Synergistota bacterium]
MLLVLNLDDIEMELLPLHIQNLLDKGAKNAYYVHSVNKKGRNGILLFVDVEESYLDDIIDYLALEMGTIGVRVLETRHISLYYEMNKVYLRTNEVEFVIPVKIIHRGSGKHVKAEYEDLRRVSKELFIPVKVIKKVVEGFSFSDERCWTIKLNGIELSLSKEWV